MTTAASLKTWYWLHKWSSLVCTIFLLLICLTGLPLIFHEEIEHAFEDGKPHTVVPEGTPRAGMDAVHANAKALYPGEALQYTYVDDHEPVVWVGMADPATASDAKSHHYMRFDAHTAELLYDGPSVFEEQFTFMGVMYALHVDLFAGLPGQLFLGFMGLLFVLATVSGVVLYGRFMKKLEFGSVRADRSRRIKWLDLHNLLGIVTVVWVTVVGVTGVINELATPMFRYWQSTEVAALIAPYQNKTPPAEYVSADAAMAAATQALPDSEATSFSHPGNMFATPHHYVFWMKGSTPLTSHLFTPVLVDATTAEVTAIAEPPWYLVMLELSRPLHFGDYGGLPLKIIWTLLDLITIVVLVSGLYLWVARRKTNDARIRQIADTLSPAYSATRS
ncbi:PepSY-associated TM helix domain-containing protein [Neopusillimonas maritima]|uniref:Peptidase n=1 Tax=Neopusillimonas maritima TaxID=2026239 RepID=A0A3A1YUN9_9BURK|nr:PepSY-associated TM helix domain-containing protein [Neopusillimonas maritima]RIY41246.1 hypothetical protein CJP73_06845 [Neopusillimonas maritima]